MARLAVERAIDRADPQRNVTASRDAVVPPTLVFRGSSGRAPAARALELRDTPERPAAVVATQARTRKGSRAATFGTPSG